MNAPRSKALAAWLAVLFGTLGLHRGYLYGPRDRWAWLHPLPTALGVLGLVRLRQMGQDDPVAIVLLPVLGLMIAQAMLTAIVWGLTADERWDARHNGGHASAPAGWGAVLAVVAALMLGGVALIGTIAFGMQHFFQWQLGR